MIAVDSAPEDELLAVAVAVESVGPSLGERDRGARSRGVLISRIEPGVGCGWAGVRATVGGPRWRRQAGSIHAGRGAAAERGRRREQAANEGRTVMVVRSGGRFLGVLGVMDTPRESARAVVAELHALGIEQTIMLTGDNQRVADAVAKHVGIRVARGDLLPEQKVAAIVELASSKSRVAMVGDGVNDAPAMANATVGIAMGAGGSDVALETADVALMADDLRALPFAVGLSRAAETSSAEPLGKPRHGGFLIPRPSSASPKSASRSRCTKLDQIVVNAEAPGVQTSTREGRDRWRKCDEA